MADITLVANTNYSALTVANGDRILLSGYALTLDVVPTAVNVEVTAVGNAGTVVVGASDIYPLVGWTLRAGTVALIATLAAGKNVGGLWIGGSVAGAAGVGTNNGTVNAVQGGSASGGHGIITNAGIVNTATGGSVANCHGVSTNNGTVGTAIGGAAYAMGVNTNQARVEHAVGGNAAYSYGVSNNFGNVLSSTGGTISTAHGIGLCRGPIITLSGIFTDATGKAIAAASGLPSILIRGENLRCAVPTGFATVYRIGELDPAATIAGDIAVVELFETGGHRLGF